MNARSVCVCMCVREYECVCMCTMRQTRFLLFTFFVVCCRVRFIYNIYVLYWLHIVEYYIKNVIIYELRRWETIEYQPTGLPGIFIDINNMFIAHGLQLLCCFVEKMHPTIMLWNAIYSAEWFFSITRLASWIES